MSEMKCSLCGQYGIHWAGNMLGLNPLDHTVCLHCGGLDCQEPPDEQDDDEEEA